MIRRWASANAAALKYRFRWPSASDWRIPRASM